MVSSVPSPEPTSTDSPDSNCCEPEACPFRLISSSLYGSAASSDLACSSVTTRRENRWPCLTIWRILASIAFRSSGVNGLSTSKS